MDSYFNNLPWEVRIGGIIIVLFFVSWFKSCEQLKYSASGITTRTTVSRISEAHNHEGTFIGYKIHYRVQIKGAGKAMKSSTVVGTDEVDNYTVGEPIEVVYVGNDSLSFSSRIKGTGTDNWVWLFYSFLALIACCIIYLTVYVILELRR